MSSGNIIGEGFADEIRKQVETRQIAYGAANRTNDQLKYFNAREPWIKLTSSVNVDSDVLDKIKIPSTYAASNLAKSFVLFGGSALNSGNALRKGFNEVYNILAQSKPNDDKFYRLSVLGYNFGDVQKAIVYIQYYGSVGYHAELEIAISDMITQLRLLCCNQNIDFSKCEKLGLDFDEVYKRTNTSYKPFPSGNSDYKSAASVERIEAFIKLGRPDPVQYEDETGPVSWEVAKTAVEKVLSDYNK